jgi:CRP-like cAMP-binding protein
MTAREVKNDPRKIATQLLLKVPLLRDLSSDVFDELNRTIQVNDVVRGQIIIKKGSKNDSFYFLLKGRLQAVDLTEDGREVGLNFLTNGDYFGELSVIDGLPRSATVVAMEDSLIASLSRAHALDLIYKNPTVVAILLKKLAESIRHASDYRGILAIPNAFQRVFALLNTMLHVAPGGLCVIDNMPTQREIAIMVNTSRETVSRALNFLFKEAIAEKDLRRLIIRKPNELNNIGLNKLVKDDF